MQRRLFCFWTGENEIPEIRRTSIESLSKTGLEVHLVTKGRLGEYIDTANLHPAFPALNLAHRSDYLRAYFMHHFGGAYCDVKRVETSWLSLFNQIEQNDSLWGGGYREVNRHGVANIYQSAVLQRRSLPHRVMARVRWRWLQLNYKRLIGNTGFIFKPRTPLTMRWWNEVNRRLDSLEPELRMHPATRPKERMGALYAGERSQYPVPWSYLQGDILHPLTLRYRSHLLKTLPKPDSSSYQ